MHKRLGIDLLPKLVAFAGVGLNLRVADVVPVKWANGRHKGFAGFVAERNLGGLRTKFSREGRHAYNAASGGTCVGVDLRDDVCAVDLLGPEYFGEVFEHAVRDSLVLLDAYLGKVACVRNCIIIQVFGREKQFLAVRGEFLDGVCHGEGFVDVLVVACAGVKTAAVTTVMANIEGFVAFGSAGVGDVLVGYRV